MFDIGHGHWARIAVVDDQVAEVHGPRPEKIPVVDPCDERLADHFPARVHVVAAHERVVRHRRRIPAPSPVLVDFEFSGAVQRAAPPPVAGRWNVWIELIDAGAVDEVLS